MRTYPTKVIKEVKKLSKTSEEFEPVFKLLDEESGRLEVRLPKEYANELEEMLKIKNLLNIHPDICPNCDTFFSFCEANNVCPKCGIKYLRTTVNPFPKTFGELHAIFELKNGYLLPYIGKLKRVGKKTELQYLVRKEYTICKKRPPRLGPLKNVNSERQIENALMVMYCKVSELSEEEFFKSQNRSKPYLV